MTQEKTQYERVLEILQNAAGGWVDGMSFLRLDSPITQFHARIFELQHAGHNIESSYVPGKNWKQYRLLPKLERGQLFALPEPVKKLDPSRFAR